MIVIFQIASDKIMKLLIFNATTHSNYACMQGCGPPSSGWLASLLPFMVEDLAIYMDIAYSLTFSLLYYNFCTRVG